MISSLSGATIYSKTEVYLGAFETLQLSGSAPGMYVLNFKGVNSRKDLKLIIH